MCSHLRCDRAKRIIYVCYTCWHAPRVVPSYTHNIVYKYTLHTKRVIMQARVILICGCCCCCRPHDTKLLRSLPHHRRLEGEGLGGWELCFAAAAAGELLHSGSQRLNCAIRIYAIYIYLWCTICMLAWLQRIMLSLWRLLGGERDEIARDRWHSFGASTSAILKSSIHSEIQS